LLTASAALLHAIATALMEQDATALATCRIVGLLLRQQTAHSAGTLVAWLQQQPEQLPFALLQRESDSGRALQQASTTADVWLSGCQCLSLMIAALVNAAEAPQPACSVAALAASMLQQLEQSGAYLAYLAYKLLSVQVLLLIICLLVSLRMLLRWRRLWLSFLHLPMPSQHRDLLRLGQHAASTIVNTVLLLLLWCETQGC
jgi:hypothetical protein